MNRSAKEIIQRLGPIGLSRALDDLLDQTHLVRLATACGLKYRGMRTQTRSRERLLADLVDRAGKREDVRKAILRTLGKESTEASREWLGLGAEEKARRLCDESFLRADGNLGLHLFLLASTGDGSELDGCGSRLAHEHLIGMASNGADSAPAPDRSREDARLRRRIQERDRKIRHLDAQLAKSRDANKTTKGDLIQRKGELAESRMLVERLRRELAQAQTAAQVATAGRSETADPSQALAELTQSVRKLASEQKTLSRRVDNLAEKAPARNSAALGPTLEGFKRILKELAAESKEHKKELAAYVKRVEGLRSELRSRPGESSTTKASRRSRSRGQADRVGVFIDVQNVYYAARKLKGKLDFDALLQAAVQNRRLIKATAYVVESKETDQSQFIAMLQKRAIEVQRKTLRVRADGSMKGNWDMELALDILDAAPQLDVVVLVSGDGDFTSLVKRVKSIGPRVEVVAFPRNTAKSLVEAADRFQPLDRQFMIYSRSKAAKERGATSRAQADPQPPTRRRAASAKASGATPAKASGTPSPKASAAATAKSAAPATAAGPGPSGAGDKS